MEMRKLGVVEAAAAIREQAVQDLSMRANPEQVHGLRYIRAIARELGMDETPENVHHIAMLLRDHGIAIHEGNEFPKWVKRGYDGARMIANDEQEEKEIVEATAPVPVEPDETAVQTATAGDLDPVSGQDKDSADKSEGDNSETKSEGSVAKMPPAPEWGKGEAKPSYQSARPPVARK